MPGSSHASSTISKNDRRNSARTRNVRLTAIRSFFGHVSRCEPALLDHCRQVLAMPSKRFEQRMVEYLDEREIKALIAAPDTGSRQGRRGPGAAPADGADRDQGERADRASTAATSSSERAPMSASTARDAGNDRRRSGQVSAAIAT